MSTATQGVISQCILTVHPSDRELGPQEMVRGRDGRRIGTGFPRSKLTRLEAPRGRSGIYWVDYHSHEDAREALSRLEAILSGCTTDDESYDAIAKFIEAE